MEIVIIGSFLRETKERIERSFPSDWTVLVGDPEETYPFLAHADVVIPEHVRINGDFLDRAPQLKLVQTGAGYDNVDIDECTRRGVRVCNAVNVNAGAVAEHTMALILSWYKNIPYLDSFMKSRTDEAALSYFGSELSQKTIGIIGLGAIGQKTASYCKAFGMNILGFSRHQNVVPDVRNVSLEELLHQSDIVSIHIPLNDCTRHMLGSTRISQMKKTSLLVNTSRGPVVNEQDLINALRNRTIAGACLDVYEQEPLLPESPLRDMPNVILTPHTAGFPDGVKYHAKRYAFFADNIRKVMNGEIPNYALNRII
jgi:D-3-phosphoglycerate dehydrogenase